MFHIVKYSRITGKKIDEYTIHNEDNRLEMVRALRAQNGDYDKIDFFKNGGFVLGYDDKIIEVSK